MIDINKMMTHIKEHVDYPATKKSLVEACNNMTEIPDDDKKWFIDNLPDKEYKSPGEVMRALKI